MMIQAVPKGIVGLVIDEHFGNSLEVVCRAGNCLIHEA